MRRWPIVVVGAVAVACGGADELAGEMLTGAGRIVVDAGQAIADAGTTLVDSGAVDAQADARTPIKSITATCDVARTVTTGATQGIEHWAALDVTLDDVVATWLCDKTDQPDSCPAGSTCSGPTIPRAECLPAAVVQYAQGKLWVSCGSYPHVKLVTR